MIAEHTESFWRTWMSVEAGWFLAGVVVGWIVTLLLVRGGK